MSGKEGFIFRHKRHCIVVEFPFLVHTRDCRIASECESTKRWAFRDFGLEWECKPLANEHHVFFPSFRWGKQCSCTTGRYCEDKCHRNVTDTTVMGTDSGHRFSLFISLMLLLLLLLLLKLLNSQIIIYYQATHTLHTSYD